MAIGSGTFEPGRIEAQMDAGEELLGFIATAGKQGGPQALHQGVGFQANRCAALNQGQIGEIFRRHPPHLIAAGEAGELHLFGTFGAGQGDRAVTREAGDNFTEQARRKGDGAAGFHAGGQAGLDAEAEIEAGETQPPGAGIGREQHVRQHRMGGAAGHGPADQLQAGAEFGLGTDQLHGVSAGRPDGCEEGAPKLPQAG